jgi:hypothetical protein
MEMSKVKWWDQSGSMDSYDRGASMLANMLGMSTLEFERDYWQQKPLLRHAGAAAVSPSQPAGMMSLSDVKMLLRRVHPRPARFLHDVDVTRYVDGRRMALSEGCGQVDPDTVWAAYTEAGYSIRLVHPQQWHQACYELCTCLQEYFGFPVGCSAYLTPKSSQGFPPHCAVYPSIEPFQRPPCRPHGCLHVGVCARQMTMSKSSCYSSRGLSAGGSISGPM